MVDTSGDAARFSNDFFQGNILEGLKKIRMRLLDLTSRNRLLNFRHTKKSSLRVIDELPEVLFNQLMDGQSLTFKAVPEPKPEDYIQEPQNGPSDKEESDPLLFEVDEIHDHKANENFRKRKPTVKEYAQKIGISTDYDLPSSYEKKDIPLKYHDKCIQTLHYPGELESILRRIQSISRTAIEESGTNMLHLAFGFLEWFDSDYSSQKHLAPLLLVPVSLGKSKKPNRKTSTFDYTIEYSGEEISPNLSLSEKLKLDFSLDLPEVTESDTPETYFSKLKGIVASKPQWRLRYSLTLGLFHFGKFLMYKDLNPDNWPLGHGLHEHQVIKDLFEGTAREGIEFSEIYDIDSQELQDIVPDLIFDADSSQHSALIDALGGRNLVIEGPPGTGKSQTITNLIAACLAEGKTVLFVSEKLAALEVVRRRLDEAGLGTFCLELHSHKTKKRQLLDDLERRIEAKGHFANPSLLDEKITLLKIYKQQLLDYFGLLNQQYGEIGIKVVDIFFARNRYRDEISLDPTMLNSIFLEQADSISISDLEEGQNDLEIYVTCLSAVQSKETPLTRHGWYGVTNLDMDFASEQDLPQKVLKLKQVSEALLKALSEFSDLTKVSIFNNPKSISDFTKILGTLPEYKGNEIPSILPKLSIDQTVSALRAFLATLSVWSKASSKLEQYFDSTPSLQIDAISEIQRFLEIINKYDLADNDIDGLGGILTRYKEMRSHIETYRPIFQTMASEFGSNVPYAADSMKFLLKAIEIINATSNDIFLMRQSSFEQEGASQYVMEAKNEFETLTALKDYLDTKFDLAKAPSVEDLHNYSSIISKAGFWSRGLSSKFRKARRAYMDIRRDKEKIPPSEIVDSLNELSAYYKLLSGFKCNESYQKVIGFHFNGLDTPFDKISDLLTWYKKVRENFPKHHSFAKPFVQSLMHDHSDRIGVIRRIAEEQKENLKQLTSILQAFDNDLADLTETIKSKASQDFDQFLHDFDLTISNIEKVIELLVDLGLKRHVPLTAAQRLVEIISDFRLGICITV